MVHSIIRQSHAEGKRIQLIQYLFLKAYWEKKYPRLTPCQILNKVAGEFIQEQYNVMNGEEYRKAIENIDKKIIPHSTQVAYKAALWIDYMDNEQYLS